MFKGSTINQPLMSQIFLENWVYFKENKEESNGRKIIEKNENIII
jgi:hypothetical protein